MYMLLKKLSVLYILGGFSAVYTQPPAEVLHTTDSRSGEKSLSFDVSTVKPTSPDFEGWRMNFTPNGFIARGVTLNALAQEAYGAYEPGCFRGAEGWPAEKKFDVVAKLDSQEIPDFRGLSIADRRGMLQRLLKDRFGLSIHVDHAKKSVLVLTVSDAGLKAPKSAPPTEQEPDQIKGFESLVTASAPGHLEGRNFTLDRLAKLLEVSEQKIIVTNPNNIAPFDFKLIWALDAVASPNPDLVRDERTDMGGRDTLRTALRKQLGLSLIPDNRMVDILVVDAVKPPTLN